MPVTVKFANERSTTATQIGTAKLRTSTHICEMRNVLYVPSGLACNLLSVQELMMLESCGVLFEDLGVTVRRKGNSLFQHVQQNHLIHIYTQPHSRDPQRYTP